MNVATLLKRLFRGAPVQGVATRLTAAQAIELAHGAVGDHWLRNALNTATPERTADGAVVWSVVTGGVGSSLRVAIDDATGMVVERAEHNGR